MQGQCSCRTSCSYYVTWYEILWVSSSAIFIRKDFSSYRKFFSQNYWATTDTVFLVLWTFRREVRNFEFKARGHNSHQEISVLLPVPCFCDSCAARVSLQQKSWVFWIRPDNPVSHKWERNLRKVLFSSCCWSVNFLELSCNSIRQK